MPTPIARFLLVLLALTLSGCASRLSPEQAAAMQAMFQPVGKANEAPLLTPEELALLEESEDPVYLLGAGDVLRVDVYARPEVSGRQVIGPDGIVTLPIVGDVQLRDLSREQAQALLRERLSRYYTAPIVTLAVEEYVSNQVTVIGRVERAGMQNFPHPPTLAEVLANAGAMPILDKQATLTRCAILRGREKLIWVDLKALLNGELAYNIRMKKGDIVFIPDSSDTAVYVLGSVTRPGSYRLTPRMTVLDALAQAGGPDEDAAPGKIGLYRAGAAEVKLIDLETLIDPSRAVNFALEDGDVLFVPKRGFARLGYVMRQLAPAISVLTFGLTAATLNNDSTTNSNGNTP
jgi:polysaccharide export outer membrane protein